MTTNQKFKPQVPEGIDWTAPIVELTDLLTDAYLDQWYADRVPGSLDQQDVVFSRAAAWGDRVALRNAR